MTAANTPNSTTSPLKPNIVQSGAAVISMVAAGATVAVGSIAFDVGNASTRASSTGVSVAGGVGTSVAEISAIAIVDITVAVSVGTLVANFTIVDV